MLALLIGLGLIFLNQWSQQNFTDLMAGSIAAGAVPSGLNRLLILLLSIGLSPFFGLLGLVLAAWAVRPDLFSRFIHWIRHPTWGVAGARDKRPATKPEAQPPSGLLGWLGITRSQGIYLALAGLFALTAALAAGDGDRMAFPLVAILGWILGIVFALAGGWHSVSSGSGKASRRWIAPSLALALILGAVALALRSWGLAQYPIVLTGDEGSVGLDGIRFLTGEVNNIFRVGWFAFPNLYFLTQGISVQILGRTIEALRMPAALIGALTVVVVFLAGRALFNLRTGMLAAIFLAFFHLHIHFSRLGLNNIWDGLLFTTTLGLLWVGWQRDRRNAYLLAGLSLGLAQYFYISSRLLWLIIPLWFLLAGFLDRGRLRTALPNLVLMAWVALVTLLPLGAYYLRHPTDYFWPILRVTDLGPGVLATPGLGPIGGQSLGARLALGLAAYLWEPLQFVWYNPGTPILRALPATFFILGVLVLLLRWHDCRTLLLGLWLVAIGLAGGLSDYTPAAQRYVAAAPAVALVLGCGLDWLLARMKATWPRRLALIYGLVGAVVLLMAIDEVNFYFVDYAPYSALGGSDTLVANQLAADLQNRSPDWQVAFFGGDRMGYGSIRSLEYLAPEIQGFDMVHPWDAAANPKLPEAGVIYVFLPGEEGDLPALQARFPHGELSLRRDFEGTILYRQYELPLP